VVLEAASRHHEQASVTLLLQVLQDVYEGQLLAVAHVTVVVHSEAAVHPCTLFFVHHVQLLDAAEHELQSAFNRQVSCCVQLEIVVVPVAPHVLFEHADVNAP
jgi:hypothetical protein